jgi:hypothetical protein
MDRQQAFHFLNVENEEDILEALEWEIFQIKKEIREKSHVPKLIESRIKKLTTLKSIEELFLGTDNARFKEFETRFSHINPLQDFLHFEEIKAKYLTQLDKSSKAAEIQFFSERLIKLTLAWALCWENFELSSFDLSEVKISVQPDSMALLAAFKELDLQGIKTYDNLENKDLPKDLENEIRRLKKLISQK